MHVVKREGGKVTVSFERSELSKLTMLLDWINDNIDVMDDGMISIPRDDISPTLQKWLNFISHDVLEHTR